MKKEELVQTLLRSFDGGAWHGPAVFECLEGVTEKQAAWQPPGDVHTIWGLTLHIAAWANEVAQRLEGGEPGEPAEGDWPMPTGKWEDALATLRAARTRLMTVAEKLTDADLEKQIGNVLNKELATGFSYAGSIEGLAQHNAYHGGQISVLKKMAGQR
jgi:uncharacterized damage-inducible protein DinB